MDMPIQESSTIAAPLMWVALAIGVIGVVGYILGREHGLADRALTALVIAGVVGAIPGVTLVVVNTARADQAGAAFREAKADYLGEVYGVDVTGSSLTRPQLTTRVNGEVVDLEIVTLANGEIVPRTVEDSGDEGEYLPRLDDEGSADD